MKKTEGSMKAREIFEYLLKGANKVWETTCDKLICGDENKEVKKAVTCFKLTAQVLDRAIEIGADMIITHEPTFAVSENEADATFHEQKKWQILKDSGIVVYRFHDHAHDRPKDYIHQGFIRDLGLKIKKKHPNESLGVARYELEAPITPREMGVLVKKRLGVECVRIVGNLDSPIDHICLGLGSVGFKQIQYLFDPGCDMFITGEVGEVRVCEYVRDAYYFGQNKSVMLLGHFSAEFAGMRLLANELNATLVPTEYIHSGEVHRVV